MENLVVGTLCKREKKSKSKGKNNLDLKKNNFKLLIMHICLNGYRNISSIIISNSLPYILVYNLKSYKHKFYFKQTIYFILL